jgi:hypothetical protein
MNITERTGTRGGLCEHLNQPVDPTKCMQFMDLLKERVAFHDEIHCVELLKFWKLIKNGLFWSHLRNTLAASFIRSGMCLKQSTGPTPVKP